MCPFVTLGVRQLLLRSFSNCFSKCLVAGFQCVAPPLAALCSSWGRGQCIRHRVGQWIRKQEKRGKWCSVKVVALYASHTIVSWGTWSGGITSASNAGGLGFKSQCVHLSRLVCVNCSCVPSATASPRAFFAGFQCVAPPLATLFSSWGRGAMH